MSDTITRETSVREAIAQYPGAEAIFEQYGLGGCGGPDGPQEPIGFFAAIHHVDPDALVGSLNDYAREQTPAAKQPAADGPSQPYRLFLATALLLTLGGGIASGIAAAMTGGGWGGLRGESWSALVQTHGHIQLFGFVVLFIVGIAFHVLPRFKQQQPLPGALVYGTYGLLAGGILMRALVQPHAQGWMRGPFVASSVLEFGGALLFAALVVRMLRAREMRESMDYFVTAAAFTLVGVTAMNIYLTIDAARDGSRVVGTIGNDAMLIGVAQGFVVLFVLGVSTRVLPFFLSLRPPRTALLRAMALVLAIAVPVRVLAAWAPDYSSFDTAWFERGAAFVAAAAILTAIAGLRVFEEPTAHEPNSMAPPAFRLAIQGAFAWLVGAVLIDVYWQLREIEGGVTTMYAGGAIRHAYLLGFATLMMMAMGYRIVPVFSGRALPWRAGVSVSLALIAAAAMLRVLPVAFAPGPTDLDFKLMVAAGFLLFGGIAIFAWELAGSMFGWRLRLVVGEAAVAPAAGAPAPVATALSDGVASAGATTNGSRPAPESAPTVRSDGPITADMTVAEAIGVHPDVLGLLIDRGFGPLASPESRAAMAPITTIERAAPFVGASAEELVAYLNEGIASAEGAADAAASDDDQLTMTMMDTTVSKAEVIEALQRCYDPEVPVNIVDLGLVFDVLVRDSYVRVTMGMTSPGCPASDMLEADVRTAMRSVAGIDTVDVEVVDEPAWTPARMSREARARLGMA